MFKVTIDHNNPTKTFPLDFGDIEAGDTKVYEVEITNDSQFKAIVYDMSINGVDHVEILNPVKEILPNSAYVAKLKVDVPIDIRKPIKGKGLKFTGRYILE